MGKYPTRNFAPLVDGRDEKGALQVNHSRRNIASLEDGKKMKVT